MRASLILPTLLLVAIGSGCTQRSAPIAPTPEPAAADSDPVSVVDVPAGTYRLEPSHASLIFRINHMGFSNYTARFKRFDAQLQFDPTRLAESSVTATVDANSLETDFPDPAKLDFNAQLRGEEWLDAAKYPQMTWRSGAVTVTGPERMRVAGELTLRGVTRPVALEVTFNGGYPGMKLDPNARIGFSARGTLNRSEFGMTAGIPPAGSNMGVSDAVEVIIEAEFSGPPWREQAVGGASTP
jgi:polyisoprenoid-binding protein YceI